MDPLLARLAGRAGGLTRRARVLLLAAGAAAVLGVAALVSGLGSAGDAAAVPIRATPAAASRAAPTPVLVQVAGAVRHPGVVSLPAGARVLDAIAAAGGATGAGDESAVPLAARVSDGQRIDVPLRAAPGSAAPAAVAGASAAPGAPVSLSTATEDQLETLPRIGPAMAARIIAWRSAHGGFTSVDQLQQVSGIGPRTFADLKDLVTP